MKKILNFKMTINIKEAWLSFKHNFWRITLTGIIFGVIYLLIHYLSQLISTKKIYIGLGGSIDKGFFLSPVFYFFALLVFPILFFILTRILLEIVDNKEKIKINSDFLKRISFRLKTYLNLLLSFIVLPIIIIIGLILFVAPGVYLTGRLFPVYYLIIDRNLNFHQALKESWKITKGIGWKLVWRLFLLGLIMISPFILMSGITSLLVKLSIKGIAGLLINILGLFLIPFLFYLFAALVVCPVVLLIMVKLFRKIENFEIKEKPDEKIAPKFLEKKEKPNYLDNIIKQ